MSKGRWSLGYGVALLLVAPLALLYMIVVTPDRDAIEETQVRDGKKKWCPFCIRAIPVLAVRCAHCGSVLSPAKVSRIAQELEEQENRVRRVPVDPSA